MINILTNICQIIMLPSSADTLLCVDSTFQFSKIGVGANSAFEYRLELKRMN